MRKLTGKFLFLFQASSIEAFKGLTFDDVGELGVKIRTANVAEKVNA